MSNDIVNHIKNVQFGSLDENLAGVSGRFAADMIGAIDPDIRTDVLESILYAQLAASGRYNAFTDPPRWYQAFFQELAGLGWVNIEYNFLDASLSEQQVSVSNLALKFLTSQEGTKAEHTVYTLSNLEPTEPAVSIFNTSGGRGTVSNFQLGTVSQAGPNIKLEGGAFYFTTNQTVTRVLKTELTKRSSKFFQSHFSSIFSISTYYNGIREVVKKRLQERDAGKYKASIPLIYADEAEATQTTQETQETQETHN